MIGSRTALAKRALALLAALTVLCGVHISAENGDGATFLRLFTAAMGSEAASDEGALQERYDAAQALFDAKEFERAYEAFEALGDFADSKARAADSKRRWTAARYTEAVDLYDEQRYAEAKEIFDSLGDYKKSVANAKDCAWRIMRIEYQQAKDLFNAGDYEGAQKMFESFGNFRDSRERWQAAADMIAEQRKADAEKAAYERGLELRDAGELEAARDALIQSGDHQDSTEQLYAVLDLITLRDAYAKAQAYLDEGMYEGARDVFAALEDYKDSADKAKLAEEKRQAAAYEAATAAKDSDPARAYVLLISLGDYRDSASLAEELKPAVSQNDALSAVDALWQSGDLSAASAGLEAIAPDEGSDERAAQLHETLRQIGDYQRAMVLSTVGRQEQANAIFAELGDFEDAADRIELIAPTISAKHLRDDYTTPKSPVFTAPDGTTHRYQMFKGVHTWVEAKKFCEILGGHLATMTSAEENAFVYQFMRDNGFLTAYFGLSDERRVGNWRWVTNEPFDYTNWHRGEPSRSGRERYGMYFYKHTDGTWNDAHFYEDAEVDPGCSYICEWDE